MTLFTRKGIEGNQQHVLLKVSLHPFYCPLHPPSRFCCHLANRHLTWLPPEYVREASQGNEWCRRVLRYIVKIVSNGWGWNKGKDHLSKGSRGKGIMKSTHRVSHMCVLPSDRKTSRDWKSKVITRMEESRKRRLEPVIESRVSSTKMMMIIISSWNLSSEDISIPFSFFSFFFNSPLNRCSESNVAAEA